jgi:thiol-disulfide isomerase/thioredoxin
MKKSIVICLGFLAVACSSNKTYIVNGTIPEEYNDQEVYMFDYDQNKRIDSAVVVNGNFLFTGVPDTTIYVRIEPSDRKLFTNVIREAGIISVDLSDYHKISGTPLNDEWRNFNKELETLREDVTGKMNALEEEYQEDEAAYSKAYEQEYEAYIVNLKVILNKYLQANPNNGIGKYVFASNVAYLYSPDEVDAIYATLGDDLKENPSIKSIMEANETKKLTAVGKMFTDFTIGNGNLDQSSVSFSDYIGKGKYVLVDFWASWCGPCIAETPVIAEVYKKYKGDKFNVLGVAVWDKREDTLEGIKKHNIVWPQIIDAQTIPTNIYGIDGIPHIILFGPDGTIVARELRGDALKKKVAEVMEQYN